MHFFINKKNYLFNTQKNFFTALLKIQKTLSILFSLETIDFILYDFILVYGLKLPIGKTIKLVT